MRNDLVLPLAACSVISAGLLLCIIVPQFSQDHAIERVSDASADAAFDELRSLEHSTFRVQKQREANNFDTAYSGMKALEAFASRTMHGDKADRRKRHISRVKTLLRGVSQSSPKNSAFPLPP